VAWGWWRFGVLSCSQELLTHLAFQIALYPDSTWMPYIDAAVFSSRRFFLCIFSFSLFVCLFVSFFFLWRYWIKSML
jgi:hypothetical protein